MSECVDANGSVLQWTISAVLTAIAAVKTIDGPEISVPSRDCTNLSSTAKGKKAGSIPNYGPLSGTCFYDPADSTHQAVLADLVAGTERAAKLIFADSGTSEYAFNGFFTRFKPTGIEVDGLLEAEFEMDINGAITLPS